MKTSYLTLLIIVFFAFNCFSQNGYEMKLGESVNVDANGNVFNSKLNPGPSNNTTTKIKQFNNDGTYKIPGYSPTGRESVDIENYKKAKYILYMNNREEYNKIFDKPSEAKTVTTISNQEFLTLPDEKQEYILSHPELYYIDINNQENK